MAIVRLWLFASRQPVARAAGRVKTRPGRLACFTASSKLHGEVEPASKFGHIAQLLHDGTMTVS
jgi:hypothetical protein